MKTQHVSLHGMQQIGSARQKPSGVPVFRHSAGARAQLTPQAGCCRLQIWAPLPRADTTGTAVPGGQGALQGPEAEVNAPASGRCCSRMLGDVTATAGTSPRSPN